MSGRPGVHARGIGAYSQCGPMYRVHSARCPPSAGWISSASLAEPSTASPTSIGCCLSASTPEQVCGAEWSGTETSKLMSSWPLSPVGTCTLGETVDPSMGRTSVDPPPGRTSVDPPPGQTSVDPPPGQTSVDPLMGRMSVDPPTERASVGIPPCVVSIAEPRTATGGLWSGHDSSNLVFLVGVSESSCRGHTCTRHMPL